ncbi:hypothetical protein CEH05_03220 [Halobacillus halophilus]|uniref:Uncharacterized protein n=1 Tax=Halobacillus halophilus (strain ATCC 35676 / DSM 2266 / JCM 20832 / KCTC 3685 / LMG 17431 / NBRC 102448 / NCIMB 2269) TaxID=866895 RepID=I0JIM1_HALH3|nr:hypothetical protein [Halobacillus halophilus]ASF38172.1 hypothetical protein CEH05_03220 [Halobacillus halophilus]CCG43989.1 hypothetical protein HBHAL_1622 [Halobacillus halophilus DSM 2266]
MTVVNKFVNLINTIPSLKDEHITEDSLKITLEFSASPDEIYSIAENIDLKSLIDDVQLNFNVNYKNARNYSRSQFISNYKYLKEDCTVRINLNKQFSNGLVFFYKSKFCNEIVSDNFKFIKVNNDKKSIVFLPISNILENEYLTLVPLEDYKPSYSHSIISEASQKKLSDYKYIINNMSSIEEYHHPLPNELFFHNDIDDDLVASSFNFALFKSITKLLANKEKNNNHIFTGYQTIDLISTTPFSPKNHKLYFLLFEFIFDKEKYFDKVEIARNVISLYQNDKDTLKALDENINRIHETVIDHFSAYVQNTIEKFFNSRKDIIKEAYESGLKIKEHTDKITQQINIIIIGIITAALSSFILYTRGGKWLASIVLVLHGVYFLISFLVNRRNYKDKGTELREAFDAYSFEFTTLKQEKIDEIKTKHIEPSILKFEGTYKLYRNTIISMIFIVLAVAISIIFLFNPPEKEQPNKNNSNPEPRTENHTEQ